MSFIAVDARRVEEACNKWLDTIELDRLQACAALIKREATKRRWFGLAKPWGYQKAFEYLESESDLYSEYTLVKTITYGVQEDELRALLNLAKASTNAVNVYVKMSYIFS